MNEKNKIWIFWYGTIRYRGKIISDNDTHWVVHVLDKNKTIELPKASTTKEGDMGDNHN